MHVVGEDSLGMHKRYVNGIFHYVSPLMKKFEGKLDKMDIQIDIQKGKFYDNKTKHSITHKH
ncbi:hypothetical protein GIB67_035906 [Kingdonia uniflora]|uniref:Uncharacterized protein n=1 Tax=Kingdonia uniflora TaxID=39325 RepID=A0A7J7P8P1_9MAGN|nr:hypothetical protein GIB67_035906 [Kingdonia uniflora]